MTRVTRSTWRTLLAMAVGMVLAGFAGMPPIPVAFFQGNAGPGAQPGDVLRIEAMAGAPAGATAQRVLYVSTGLDGAPIAVSGVVIVPPGAAPQGRNVVAWAHPTTGVEPPCAPSLRSEFYDRIPGLKAILAQGYVVIATDYPGLGTPGPHPYLVGVSEARAVLDSVRAVQRIPAAQATSRFAVWGHSQGGHAALFTGQIAKAYAPERTLVGVAAAAPATDLGTLLRDDMGTTIGKMLTAYSLWSWSIVYNAPLTDAVAPQAMRAVGEIAGICLESRMELIEASFDAQPLKDGFLEGKPLDKTPWRGFLTQNEPGKAAAGAPVFIAQGTIDTIVRPEVTAAFIGGLCARGEQVRVLDMAGVGHITAGVVSADAAVAWIDARFAGAAAPNDCAQRTGTR